MGIANRKAIQAVVIGSLARDRIEPRGRVEERIGGVVWSSGVTLARLGIQVRVLTRIAEDDQALVNALQCRGVEVSWRTATRTTNFVNRYDDDGQRTQLVPSVAEPIEAEGAADALGSADLVYLGPLHPDDLADDVVPVLSHVRPNMVALDVQGYTRRVRQGTITPGLDRRLQNMLAVCDVIKASDEEAELVTGLSDPEDAARALASSGLEAIVTCGADGSFICYRGGRHFEPAVVTQTADPTGAGDIFFAAYLANRLDDRTVEAAANFAAGYTSKRLASADMAHLLER